MVGGAPGWSGQPAHGPAGAGCSAVHASATTQCEEENERVGHDSSVISHVVLLGPRASLVSSLSL